MTETNRWNCLLFLELLPLSTSSYDPVQEEHHTQGRGLHCQQKGHPKSHWSALGPLLLHSDDDALFSFCLQGD